MVGLSIPTAIEKDAETFSKLIKKGISNQKDMKKMLKLEQKLISFGIMSQKEFEQIAERH